jgi:hypothetical protein
MPTVHRQQRRANHIGQSISNAAFDAMANAGQIAETCNFHFDPRKPTYQA